MELAIFQKGFNYSQDGPGNRLVYHLQGCNLHCPWCSNPEGMSPQGGERRTVDELVAEVLRSRPMFFDGGGVTLTGGEATLQFPAVLELLQRLHQAGVHTAIETNGTHPHLPELFPFLRYMMIDCKHFDPQRFAAVTGGALDAVVANLHAARSRGLEFALRIPVIGGFNDGPAAAEGFVRLLDPLFLSCRTTVELLPYHEYGKDKWAALGRPYQMTGEAFVSPETIAAMEAVFQARGYQIVHT